MATTDPAPYLNSLKLTTTQSTTLSTFIAKSLTTLSYTPTTTSAVATLAARNTHTITVTGLQSLLHHPSRTYGTSQALAQLFNNLTAKDLRINTNEPVLLVNSSTLSNTHLQEIATAATNLLRYQHHIRPVRIYAGNFATVSSDGTGSETPKGFSGFEGYSLSLLNVVNTDIGGPGMVQLLDMVDWEAEGAVRAEVWDGSGWNLVREVKYAGRDCEGRAEEDGNENGSERGGSEKGEWESEAEDDAEVGAEPECEREEQGKEEHGKDAEAEAEMHEEDDRIDALPTPDSHTTAEEQVSDPEIQRPPLRSIKHPSWERSQDNESLLDMISKQAKTSNLPVSKAGNAYATSASGKKEKAELQGEDEYEVI